MPFKIIIGDITAIKCDVLVNYFIGKFGNDSCFSKKICELGGTLLLKECNKVKSCAVGESVITNAFGMAANYIIHTVVPDNSIDVPHLLANSYKSAFELCENKGLQCIAYPLIIDKKFNISTEKAIKIALNRIVASLKYSNEEIMVCLVVSDIETFNLTFEMAKDIIPDKYYTIEETFISSKKADVIYTSAECIQKSLIENYELHQGTLSESQIGKEQYKQWSVLMQTVYQQTIKLNDKEWDNPTELIKISKGNEIWNTLKYIFREMIGLVNDYQLKVAGDIVCLLMAYATKKDGKQSEVESRFRVKFEYYLARQIIEQKNKSHQILEDEKVDINAIRRLRKRKNNSKTIDKLDEENKTTPKWNKDSILYIYKGNIRCHRYAHNIIQATAVLHDKTDNEILLNVEYCEGCKKFLLEYTVFQEYRNRYGVIIGNFRMATQSSFVGEYNIAQESPLMLSGYNVSQRDGHTSSIRHYILARIIHDGIMSKGEVVRYLSYFIRKNGAKQGNEVALDKWKEDLMFVQQYNINIQPKTIISGIQKY